MKWLNDIKTGAKLIGAFIIVILLCVTVGIVGYFNMKSMDDGMAGMYNDQTVPIEQLGQINSCIYEIRGELYKYVLFPGERDNMEKGINDLIASVDNTFKEYSNGYMEADEKKAAAEFDMVWPAYKKEVNGDLALVKAENTDAVLKNISSGGSTAELITKLDDITTNLSEINVKGAEQMDKNGQAGFAAATILSAAVCLVAIILGLVIALVLTRSITGPLNKGVGMMKELGMGHLNSRLKMVRRDEIGVLTATMDQFADDLQNTVIGTMKKISDGDVSTDVKPKDKDDEISPALIGIQDSIRNMVTETDTLVKAAVEGRLATRADAGNYKGDYQKVVAGVNKTLDAVIGPLNVAGDYVDNISKGNIPPRITDNYNGDFNIIKNNLNKCIDAVNLLVSDANMLSTAAVEGRLMTRADASKHEGDFRKIIQGVNDTLDNVILPINEAAAVLDREAKDDLTTHVTGSYKGDLDKIKVAMNAALDSRIDVVLKLKQVAGDLAESSKQLTIASEQAGQATQQIAGSSQQVAKGASDQATALQDTLKAMEALSQTVEQIARGAQEQAQMIEKNVQLVGQVSTAISQVSANAQNAAAGAKTASDSAQKGAVMARETVRGMENVKKTMDMASSKVNGLGERSKEIGKIVSAIDDIADQTNLLALNAAVEAARAGEQGRGFAVVADEVRKLAERAQAATKEIADLISGIQGGVADTVVAMEKGTKEVDGGYDLANKAGQSLDDILAHADQVGQQVEQISNAAHQLTSMSTEMVKLSDSISAIVEENTAATEEMAGTVKQVSKSVENVAGVAEENSAATEQVSSAAEEISAQVQQVVSSGSVLSGMATDFEKLVAKYRLNGNGHIKENTEALASAAKN